MWEVERKKEEGSGIYNHYQTLLKPKPLQI